jgi:hypothetical protein
MGTFGKLHYLDVGPKGTFAPSGALVTTPADVDAIFAHLAADPALAKVTLYFHGGLVEEKAGLAVAEKMFQLFDTHSHMVGFVWETGPVETIRANLDTLQNSTLFKKLVKLAIRHAAARLGGAIGGKGPGQPLTVEEIDAELAKATRFDGFDAGARGAAAALDEEELEEDRDAITADIEADLGADDDIDETLAEEAAANSLLAPEVAVEAQEEQAKGFGAAVMLAKHLASVVIRVVKRFIRKRDHGFYPTVVEETVRELYLADVGAWLWSGMKGAAEGMWAPNVGPVGDDSHAGTYFLEKLAALQAARPGLIVDLVGHSAGSIAICHLLAAAAARHPALRFRNVLFLAPACTCELFEQGVLGHTGRFQSFRMFTMKDDLETQDRLVPAVYTRSLLYLISGILEDEADTPIAGLELHTRGQAPYTAPTLLAVQQYVRAPGTSRLVLAETQGAGDGLNSASHSHGAFDDDPATRASLLSIVSG